MSEQRSPKEIALDRAVEMLRVAARFMRKFEPDGLIDYDGAPCDSWCVADDCEAAATDIEGWSLLARIDGEGQ